MKFKACILQIVTRIHFKKWRWNDRFLQATSVWLSSQSILQIAVIETKIHFKKWRWSNGFFSAILHTSESHVGESLELADWQLRNHDGCDIRPLPSIDVRLIHFGNYVPWNKLTSEFLNQCQSIPLVFGKCSISLIYWKRGNLQVDLLFNSRALLFLFLSLKQTPFP